MLNKKIVLSLLLVLCIAFSVSAVTAENSDDNVIADANDNDVITETNNNNAVDDVISSKVEDNPKVSSEKKEETGSFDGLDQILSNVDNGDEISLKENAVYNVGNKTWDITKSNVKIIGKNTTINVEGSKQKGKNAGTFMLNGENITLYGIIFNNTDGIKSYGQTVSGCPVVMFKNKQTMDNCSSLYFSKGVLLMGATNAKISNCYFTGSTTSVTGTGSGEKGTYGIAGGSTTTNVIVENNIFDGQMLDGISFYGNSKTYVIKNNTFKNNVYAIYFGGASTEGSEIIENNFINCGYCEGNKEVSGLAIIDAKKSADGYKIINNKFTVVNGSVLINTAQGDTSHGSPAAIGNITITGNTITPDSGVDISTLTFVYILTKEDLKPIGDIVIKNNALPTNIAVLKTEYQPHTEISKDDNILIPSVDKLDTTLNIADISTADKKVVILLKDSKGNAIVGEQISYKINGGKAISAGRTLNDGTVTINLNEDCTIDVLFDGTYAYAASSTSIRFKVPTVEKPVEKVVEKTVEKAPEAQVTKLTATKKTFKRKAKTKKFTATLKTNDGKAIKNKYVSFKIGKNTYVAKTNAKGVATVSLKLTKKGTYTVKVKFDGDAGYKTASKSAKIVVK